MLKPLSIIGAILLVVLASKSTTAQSDQTAIVELMQRVERDTVCLVHNTFWIRELAIYTTHVGFINDKNNSQEAQEKLIAPLYENEQIFTMDRAMAVIELIHKGAKQEDIETYVNGVTGKAISENLDTWANVRNTEDSRKYIATLITKQRACNLYLKTIQGQKI